ncbi:MAG: hypothetical protein LBI69_03270 [Puniceicoccales bacterium]|nr:hypothetical protein [Puniceicoccales bacterium]
MVDMEYYLPTAQEEWRQWLEDNGQSKRGVWILFPYVRTKRPRISYVQALEEALCFGWIDGMVKRHSDDILSQRFTPRAQKSSWSEVNKQHARLLIKSGKMRPAGYAVLPDLDENNYVFPEDILNMLRGDEIVWKNFCAFPAYYKNIRVAAIDNLRGNREKFHVAMDIFIRKTRQNHRYGRFR